MAWNLLYPQVPPPPLLSRLQKLYYEIVNVLCLMLEDLPQEKTSHSSELLI